MQVEDWKNSQEYKLECEARYYINLAKERNPRSPPKRWLREKLEYLENKSKSARPRPDLRRELNRQFELGKP